MAGRSREGAVAEAVDEAQKVRRSRKPSSGAAARNTAKVPKAEPGADGRPMRRAEDRQSEALRNELFGIAVLAASVGLLLALGSFNPDDVRATGQAATTGRAHNLIGPVGAFAGDLLLRVFGLSAFLLPLTLAIPGFAFLTGRRIRIKLGDVLGYPVMVLACATAAHLWMAGAPVLGHDAGGVIGTHSGEILLALFGLTGAYIVVYAVITLTFIATTRISLVRFVGAATRPLAGPAAQGAAGVQRHAQGVVLGAASRLKAWRATRLEIRTARAEAKALHRAASGQARAARIEAKAAAKAAALAAREAARTVARQQKAARTSAAASESAVRASDAAASRDTLGGSRDTLGGGRDTLGGGRDLSTDQHPAPARPGLGARLAGLFGRGRPRVDAMARPDDTGAFSLGAAAGGAHREGPRLDGPGLGGLGDAGARHSDGFSADFGDTAAGDPPRGSDRPRVRDRGAERGVRGVDGRGAEGRGAEGRGAEGRGAEGRGGRGRAPETDDRPTLGHDRGDTLDASALRPTPAPGDIAAAILRSERRVHGRGAPTGSARGAVDADTHDHDTHDADALGVDYEDPLDAEAHDGPSDTMLAPALSDSGHRGDGSGRPEIHGRRPQARAAVSPGDTDRGAAVHDRHAAERAAQQQASQDRAARAAEAARAQAERAVQAVQAQAERAAREARVIAERAARAAQLEAERAAQAEAARALGVLTRDSGVRGSRAPEAPPRDTRAGDTRAGDTRAGDTRAGDTRGNETAGDTGAHGTFERPTLPGAVVSPPASPRVNPPASPPASLGVSPRVSPPVSPPVSAPVNPAASEREAVALREAQVRAARLAQEAENREIQARRDAERLRAVEAEREAEAARESQARALQARREAEAAREEARRLALAGKPASVFGAAGGGMSGGGLGGGSLGGAGFGGGGSGSSGSGSSGSGSGAGGVKVIPGRKAAEPGEVLDLAIPAAGVPDHSGYVKPSLHFLDYKAPERIEIDPDFLHDQADRLVEALRTFRIDGRVTEIHPGPVITMFEFEPAPGVRISRIAGLADDLAMALKAVKVRIVAPIPGKGVVGFEVPNEHREMVFLKEIIGSKEFQSKSHALPMALGKDIHGDPAVTDLAKMPHLLVAGTTGSGKSVGVNGMITSLLYHLTPDEVRFIMVDPKMLELSIYEGIPHLLLPVVTDPKKAALALKWAVDEMERRYETMKDAGVRDIRGYNRKVETYLDALAEATRREAHGEYAEESELVSFGELFSEGEPPRKLPYIVVVIDEFADLMMVAGKEVEYCVARIAQKARAAGIHLILATQRPSTDVITGVIKANFPTRMAFRVSSGIDSRTILSTNGAENLLGQGDMLFMPPGTSRLMRVHGAYVSEDEIHKVVEFIAAQQAPEYLDESILADPDEAGDEDGEGGDQDVMYEEAVRVVARDGKASTSHLQRKLSLGYNRAARIVDQMERDGLVGPANGAKPRPVYKQVINDLVARWES